MRTGNGWLCFAVMSHDVAACGSWPGSDAQEASPGTCLWRDGSGRRGAVDRAEVVDVPLATPGDQRENPERALLPCDRPIAHPRPVDPPVGPLVVLLPG